MGNPRPEKENIIKDIRNLSKIQKKTKAIKDKILRDIQNLFEHKEEENYYKSVRLNNFWSNNYIEYEGNANRNKKVSAEEHLNKISRYLKGITNNLRKSGT